MSAFQLEEHINLPFILRQERFLDYFRIKGFVVFILLNRKLISLLAFFGSWIGTNPSEKELENLLPWKINLGK